MAEQSYYPLNPLKYPFEDTGSPSPEQPLKDDADPLYPTDTTDPSGSLSSMFLSPLRPQLFRKNQFEGHRLHSWRRIRTPLEMALLPLAAIGYLAFCYTVHGKVVPVNTYGLYAVTTQHLTTIKGGITSISIIIISIALYPAYVIVSSLKSEEFFRVLASQSRGVPLETINHVSTPSFGRIDQMVAMWKHTCSNHYILGIVASLLMWIVATLAPGTLTVQSVLSDGELMAFAIGAVAPQSVLNGSFPQEPAFNASLNSNSAASIMWAELELGVQYSFSTANSSEPGYAAYIAPVPLDLPATTSARWLSDVIGMNPACSWASTNLTTPIQIPENSTSAFDDNFATAYLLDFDLDVKVTSTDTSFGDGGPFAIVKNPTTELTNHTTQAPASDGSTVFLLGQCQSGSGCVANLGVNLTLNLSGIEPVFTIALTDQLWIMAILVCKPNITIETREVRNDGGIFSVQPLPDGHQLTRQGNLNSVQTTALLSIVTMSLSLGTDLPSTSQGLFFQLGTQVQGELLFGKAQYNSLPQLGAAYGTLASITPAPVENITEGYIRVVQSGLKVYLMGYLGTAYVPGRTSASEIVFAASIPNLVVSSVVFGLLIVLIVFAHFRSSKGVEFTLVNVTAAVHGSELPAQFAQVKGGLATGAYEDINMGVEGDMEMDGSAGTGNARRVSGTLADQQEDIVKMFGERRIFMQRRANGSSVLRIS